MAQAWFFTKSLRDVVHFKKHKEDISCSGLHHRLLTCVSVSKSPCTLPTVNLTVRTAPDSLSAGGAFFTPEKKQL
jgi:hypothetical protein